MKCGIDFYIGYSPGTAAPSVMSDGLRVTGYRLPITYQITYPNYDVIVVDTGSEDDALKRYIRK